MMRIFQMREPSTPIEAFVISSQQEEAAKLFELYVRAYEGDPDTLLWRELELQQLDDPEHSVLAEAINLDRAGVVSPDFLGRWAIIATLGEDKEHD